MNPGVSSWDELGPITGNILLIVNSADDEVDAVGLVLSELDRLAPSSALHVIAAPTWIDWFERRSVARERMLASADESSSALELNHFLESAPALNWALARQFQVIIGSSAHSLYNEEIKTIFEQNLCLLGRDAWFVLHALPSPFLYVLDTAALVERFSRGAKQARYESVTRGIVDDLHRLWIARGRPSHEDGAAPTGAFAAVVARLDRDLHRNDESALSSSESGISDAGQNDLVMHLRDVLHDQTRQWQKLTQEIERLSSVVDERNAAVILRDQIIDERNAALVLRDQIIGTLKLKLQPTYRKLLQLLRGSRS